ncbi:MAG: zinc-ribbon domain-containing protein [bacterium]|nr:zinc-ribbon domain-containing protein [bacterium]
MSEQKRRFKKSVAETPLVAEYLVEENGNVLSEEVSAASLEPVWWICRVFREGCGKKFRTSPNNRINRRQGCPACAIRANTLTTTIADVGRLAVEYHPTRNEQPAHEVLVTSNERVWWICAKKHEWRTTPCGRYYRPTGCPRCYQGGRHKSKNKGKQSPESG